MLGGGLEIVLASDITIVAEDAVFGLSEITHVLIAAGDGAFRLPRAIPAARARKLVLAGERFGAAEAHGFGLVNHIFPGADLLPTEERIARSIAAHPAVAVRETLTIARTALDIDEAEVWRRSAEASRRTGKSGDRAAGARAFTQARSHANGGTPEDITG
jgi:enoyl-CoA hydratase/carnithine racemase